MRPVIVLRRLLGVLLLLALPTLAIMAIQGGFAFDVRLTEARLNESAAAKLPLERKSGPVVWRVESAKLTVLNHGRLGVDASVKAKAGGREAQAHVIGSGALAYRDGAFWVSAIHVDTLDQIAIRKIDPEKPPSKIGKVIGDVVARHESLKELVEEVKEDAADLALKHADDALDAVFAKIPVYRLHDDWKGSAARQVLVSVRTDGHDLVATIDPVGQALRIAAVIVIGAVFVYCLLCLLAGFTSFLGGASEGLLFWW